MNTPFDIKGMDLERLVYVRPVDVSDLPEDLQEQAQGPSERSTPFTRRTASGWRW